MFIQTETTPNPETLKFLPGTCVIEGDSVDFADEEFIKGQSPLAERLFRIEGVKGVFFGYDFISISKAEKAEWYLLKPAILGTIMEHFVAGLPVLNKETKTAGEQALDTPVVRHIKELLDKRVRPAVARDGGDIVFHNYEDGIVYLTMKGACAGCPSSTATLKMGIENLLRHYIPEVQEVRPVSEFDF